MSSNSILEIFGRNVQKYRKEQRLSQEKLAEYAGLHRTYIGNDRACRKKHNSCQYRKNSKSIKY